MNWCDVCSLSSCTGRLLEWIWSSHMWPIDLFVKLLELHVLSNGPELRDPFVGGVRRMDQKNAACFWHQNVDWPVKGTKPKELFSSPKDEHLVLHWARAGSEKCSCCCLIPEEASTMLDAMTHSYHSAVSIDHCCCHEMFNHNLHPVRFIYFSSVQSQKSQTNHHLQFVSWFDTIEGTVNSFCSSILVLLLYASLSRGLCNGIKPLSWATARMVIAPERWMLAFPWD